MKKKKKKTKRKQKGLLTDVRQTLNIMATEVEPHECVIFVQSTKIGTHENKGNHSMPLHSFLHFLLHALTYFQENLDHCHSSIIVKGFALNKNILLNTSKFRELWSPARQQIWPLSRSKVTAKVTAPLERSCHNEHTCQVSKLHL